MNIIFPVDQVTVPTEDQQHFINTVNQAARWEVNKQNIVTIYLRVRETSGWLEHGISVTRSDGSRVIYIGAIQRAVKAQSEFHS